MYCFRQKYTYSTLCTYFTKDTFLSNFLYLFKKRTFFVFPCLKLNVSKQKEFKNAERNKRDNIYFFE